MSDQPQDPSMAGGENLSRDFFLAQALEEQLRETGSDTPLLDDSARGEMPAWARDEGRSLAALARAVSQAGTAVRPTGEFSVAARSRLMNRIAADAAPTVWAEVSPLRTPAAAASRRLTPWIMRVAAGLAAFSLASFATVGVSANSLPGEPLYGLKRATEAVSLELAPPNQRTVVLLRQADARLDEVLRLTGQGRGLDAAALASSYIVAVEQATAEMTASEQANVANLSAGGEQDQRALSADELRAKLEQHREQLSDTIARAPEQALPGLTRALEVAGRGLERAAEVREARSQGSVPGPAQIERARGQDNGETGRQSDAIPTRGATVERAAATPRATVTHMGDKNGSSGSQGQGQGKSDPGERGTHPPGAEDRQPHHDEKSAPGKPQEGNSGLPGTGRGVTSTATSTPTPGGGSDVPSETPAPGPGGKPEFPPGQSDAGRKPDVGPDPGDAGPGASDSNPGRALTSGESSSSSGGTGAGVHGTGSTGVGSAAIDKGDSIAPEKGNTGAPGTNGNGRPR